MAQTSDQLDFPILYGSSKLGFVTTDPKVITDTMQPLFDAILKHIPAPVSKSDHLQFLTTSLDHSDFLGPIAIGRVFSGEIKVGQQVICCRDTYISKPTKITKIYKFKGLERIETQSAHVWRYCSRNRL